MRAARILALTWLALMAMTLGTFRAGTEGAATAGVVLAIATLKAHLIAAVFMELLRAPRVYAVLMSAFLLAQAVGTVALFG